MRLSTRRPRDTTASTSATTPAAIAIGLPAMVIAATAARTKVHIGARAPATVTTPAAIPTITESTPGLPVGDGGASAAATPATEAITATSGANARFGDRRDSRSPS